MAGLKYWVWLSECRGLTNRSRALLLDHFGSPEDVYYADEAEYALVEGLSKKQLELLADKSTDGADKILGDCQRLGLRILTMQDADYPARLRGIFEPPCLLYVKGTLPAFDEEVAVAMVGTRACTPYGTQSAEKIAYGLAKQGALVVSGAARGIDSAAHRGALRAGGVTVAVLGNGLDVVYPEENAGLYRDIAATGALLSEYPPGTAAEGWHFPIRNRIISGLSLGVVVVEAASRSGTLITSRLALEQGREVYAVPGAALSGQSLGCQELVRQGAKPVFAPEDVLEDLAGPLRDFGVQADHLTREAAERRRRAEAEGTGLSRTLFACMPPETDTPPKADSGNGEERPTQGAGDTDTAAASPAQDTIIPLLREQGPLHVDALGAALGRSPAELAPVLLGLEIMGRIRRLPGARYEAV